MQTDVRKAHCEQQPQERREHLASTCSDHSLSAILCHFGQNRVAEQEGDRSYSAQILDGGEHVQLQPEEVIQDEDA